MNELKYCKFCNKEKPIKDFVKSGFAIKNICRECQNKKQTQIYKNSKEVDKLQQENEHLKERIEYLERSNNRREDTILEQRQEISDLEDNWNKLKEYLFDIRKRGFALQNLANVTKNTEPNIAILIIINKMKEMEKNYGDVENNT